jgi:hypothetical protein
MQSLVTKQHVPAAHCPSVEQLQASAKAVVPDTARVAKEAINRPIRRGVSNSFFICISLSWMEVAGDSQETLTVWDPPFQGEDLAA